MIRTASFALFARMYSKSFFEVSVAVGLLGSAGVSQVLTSLLYGVSPLDPLVFGGVAALLTMLNACSANVVVVNIDSGFKGGYVAAMIARDAMMPPTVSR